MNTDVRKLTDGAMMVAIVGVLMLIDRQFAGFFSMSFTCIFPLPMVFYTAKYGLKNSWMVLAAIVILAFILSTPQGMIYIASESLIGTIYGHGVHKKIDNKIIVMRTILLTIVLEVFGMIVFAAFFGYDFNGEVDLYMDWMTDLMNQMNMQLPANFDLTQFILSILVLSVILTGILEGFIIHVVARFMLKRFKIPVPEPTPLWEYRPPKWTGYVALLLYILSYWNMGHPFENEIIREALPSLALVGMFYLAIFGVIGSFVILPRQFPNLGKWTVFIVLFAFLFMSILVAIMGFFYITTDWYKPTKKGEMIDASKINQS